MKVEKIVTTIKMINVRNRIDKRKTLEIFKEERNLNIKTNY
jgi:hypothetical protein|tara:strand:+ start:218 stop:340 length:123 start_codon:yes stop_codon:yes gene_type:complete